MRDNIEAVHEYSALKKELASKYEHDIDSYIEKKTTFITRILSITGLKQSQLIEIASQNKK
ncbi:MAG: GrpB family protein [Thermoplasmata archaeon]|nr:GrpB family protein [Thermoplasmata archaeon]